MRLLDFERHLKKHSCILIRQGSNHTIYQNPQNGKNVLVPRHREVKKALTLRICKQLEIPSPP